MESEYKIGFYVSVPGKLFSSVLIIRDANNSMISDSMLIVMFTIYHFREN